MPSRVGNNEDAGHKQRNWKEGEIKMFPPIAPAGKLCNLLIIEFVFILSLLGRFEKDALIGSMVPPHSPWL